MKKLFMLSIAAGCVFVFGTADVVVAAPSEFTPDIEAIKKGNDAMAAGNQKEAVKFYTESAQLGNSEAMSLLGHAYQSGIGVARDDAKAIEWYKKAAAKGDKYAQQSVDFLELRRPVRPQIDINLLKSKAEKGDAQAAYDLGLAYYTGSSIKTDKVQALKWLLPAAQHGNAAAQVTVAGIYQQGKDVPRNFYSSYLWWKIVELHGDRQFVSLMSKGPMDIAKGKLSAAQITHADRQAAEWKAAP